MVKHDKQPYIQQGTASNGGPIALSVILILIFVAIVLYFIFRNRDSGVQCQTCSNVPGYIMHNGSAPTFATSYKTQANTADVIAATPESVYTNCMIGGANVNPYSGGTNLSCNNLPGCVGVAFDSQSNTCTLLSSTCDDDGKNCSSLVNKDYMVYYEKDCDCLSSGSDAFNQNMACDTTGSYGYQGCSNASCVGKMASYSCYDTGYAGGCATFSNSGNSSNGMQSHVFESYGAASIEAATLQFGGTASYQYGVGMNRYTMTVRYYDDCVQKSTSSDVRGSAVDVTHAYIYMANDCMTDIAMVFNFPKLLCMPDDYSMESNMGSATDAWTQPGAIIVTKGRFRQSGGCGNAGQLDALLGRLMSLTKCGDDDGACDKVQWAKMYLQDKALQTLLNDDLVPDSTTILWSPTGFDADGDTTGVCVQSGCRGREAMSCSTSAATCERGGNIGSTEVFADCEGYLPDCVDSTGNAIAVRGCVGYNAYEVQNCASCPDPSGGTYCTPYPVDSSSLSDYKENHWSDGCETVPYSNSDDKTTMVEFEGMSGVQDLGACAYGNFAYYVCSDGTVNPQNPDAACQLCLTDSDCSGDATCVGRVRNPYFGKDFSCPSCLKTSCCYDKYDADNENAMFAQCVAKKETVSVWIIPTSGAGAWCNGTVSGHSNNNSAHALIGNWPLPDSTNRSSDLTSVLGFGDLPITDSQLWTDQDGNYIGVSSKQDPEKITWGGRLCETRTLDDSAFSSLKEIPLALIMKDAADASGADTSGTTDIPLSTSACESLAVSDQNNFDGSVAVSVLRNKEPALYFGTVNAVDHLLESGGDSSKPCTAAFDAILKPINQSYNPNPEADEDDVVGFSKDITPCMYIVSDATNPWTDGSGTPFPHRAFINNVRPALYGAWGDSDAYQAQSFLATSIVDPEYTTGEQSNYICNLTSSNV